ncbi:SMP-30/gluconolactonase/LRE family protein [Paraburkholderia sp.]|uniref:SMP-30/gluconolactonase/LRE family protein n=1 Tax=Paraburkholderia sp. TaxID=1926495 RepID=UPI0039E397F0
MELKEIASDLKFPEGPLAMENGDFLICEVAGGTIRRVGRDGKVSLLAEPGGAPSGLAFGPDGYCYVCNGGIGDFQQQNGRLLPHFAPAVPPRGSIQRLDVETGKIEPLYTECDGRPLIAPNDLVIDAHGGIWFTDHGKVRRDDRDHGALYYAKTDGSLIRRMIAPLLGPNGVALSPDGARVYVAETPTARVWRFDLAGPGEIARSPEAVLGSRGHLLAGLGGWQWLDSMKVDAEGWVCVATLFNGGITAISPDGRQIEHHAMPDRFTTNLAFGGADLRTAFIVLSSLGKIVAARWPRPGLRLNHAR